MNLRTSAVTVFAAFLLLALAFLSLGTDGTSRSAVGPIAQAATLPRAPAGTLPFEVVIEQSSGEHRTLKAAEDRSIVPASRT